MENKYGSHLGYDIFKDEEGFYINGLNGLNEPTRIYRSSLGKLVNWIDLQFKAYLER